MADADDGQVNVHAEDDVETSGAVATAGDTES